MCVIVAAAGVAGVWRRGNDLGSRRIGGGVTLTIVDQRWPVGEKCAGTGPYGDIRAGARVVVTDGTGEILGTGRLDQGYGVAPRVGGFSVATDQCWFPFDVGRVARTPTYRILVSGGAAATRSERQLAATHWNVELSLGPAAISVTQNGSGASRGTMTSRQSRSTDPGATTSTNASPSGIS